MHKIYVLLIIGLFFLTPPCFGITLLMEEEALQRVFPDIEDTDITMQKITASQEQIEAIKKALGGRLTHILREKGAQEINQQRDFTFYFAKKEGRLSGAALIIDEPGKWGLIKFIVRLSPQGEIRGAAVMAYKEVRGRPIASQSFLRQFAGKSLNSPLRLNQDIQAISGATVSSEAACFVMKKAMVLYKELALK